MHAVLAILAALVRRGVSGAGCYLDVSAVEGVLSLMSLAIDQYLATGEVAGPRQTLLTGRYAFYDLYRARDGKWLSVGAIEPHFYANLCKALGLPQYTASQLDGDRQDEIRAAFKKVFAQRDRDDWVALLAPNDTCVAPVYTLPELVEDPHFASRGIFMDALHPSEGRFRQLGPVLAGGDRAQPVHPVRPPGETDVASLLAGVGMESEEIDALREQGVVE
jgi:alpha-methylacyl-CoA racemase